GGGGGGGGRPGAPGFPPGATPGPRAGLERAAYARREPDPDDRRKVRVLPLPGVERRMQPLFEPMQRGFVSVLAAYSDRELKLLLNFITRAHAAAVWATEAVRGTAPRTSAATRRGNAPSK